MSRIHTKPLECGVWFGAAVRRTPAHPPPHLAWTRLRALCSDHLSPSPSRQWPLLHSQSLLNCNFYFDRSLKFQKVPILLWRTPVRSHSALIIVNMLSSVFLIKQNKEAMTDQAGAVLSSQATSLYCRCPGCISTMTCWFILKWQQQGQTLSGHQVGTEQSLSLIHIWRCRRR